MCCVCCVSVRASESVYASCVTIKPFSVQIDSEAKKCVSRNFDGVFAFSDPLPDIAGIVA